MDNIENYTAVTVQGEIVALVLSSSLIRVGGYRSLESGAITPFETDTTVGLERK